jgi:amylosucrase
MYEQVSHSLLNRILDQLDPEFLKHDLRHFHTRLGANFYAIHSLFRLLYGKRADFEAQMVRLVEVMASHYLNRDESLKATDTERERNHTWFLDQQWVGMALYANAFAGDLKGLHSRLRYLQELGVNLVHVMPVLKCPPGASDGGYAVSDFRDVDERVGTIDELRELSRKMRTRGMLLTLDVVVNHTSDQHEWAQRARSGEKQYQDYYHVYDSRENPDAFEEAMPEIFPETAPGNFTFDEAMGKWVMTVFNTYQWDLNYANPAVFTEMLDIILFWANQGADILRLDAVAFLWKKMGTACQNEHEAHLILQLLKDCCQVSAPGVLFIAEAIVAPVEIIKYFGEDAVIAKECEIAYNATLMALLWDGVATGNSRLLNQGIQHLPNKLDQATWLNYVRCHDDIGLGFDDADVLRAGYNPRAHRKFLVDYFTGNFPGSPARGKPFGVNDKSQDARIAGSLASLAGLEFALEEQDDTAVDHAIDLILLLHSVILSFGGIPLLYYGDEIGTLNDLSYLQDENKAGDSRWMHRPQMDWNKAERRNRRGTVEQRLFDGLKHLIAVRKNTPALADFNNRELLKTGNPYLFAFLRQNPLDLNDQVLVVANFDRNAHAFDLELFDRRVTVGRLTVRDLCTGQPQAIRQGQVEVPALTALWLRPWNA